MQIKLTSETVPVISTIFTIMVEDGDQMVKYQLERRTQSYGVEWRWWRGPQPNDFPGVEVNPDDLKTQCIAAIGHL